MKAWLLGALELSALAAGCGADDVSVEGGQLQSSQPIVNGTRDPQVVTLSDGQRLAIGYLAGRSGSAFCSGTLVTSRAVVTARHCIRGVKPESLYFGIGVDPRSPDAFLPVATITANDNIDFALLILGLDAVTAAPSLVPIGYNRTRLDQAWVGRWVDAAGFGETRGSGTGRFFARVQIIGYDATSVIIDGHGDRGICFGDSGGPILWQPEGEDPVVVGTEQFGDVSCVDVDHLARLDILTPWLDEQLAAPLPPLFGECGDVGSRGVCNGDMYQYCAGGYLRTNDCGANGDTCGIRDSGQLGCLPRACLGVDFLGECVDNVIHWCDGVQVATRDCNAEGSHCERASGTGQYQCGCVPCDGVCTDLGSSVANCGACGKACDPDNAYGECVMGRCRISTCRAGYEDTDGDASNGCETGGKSDALGCDALDQSPTAAALILLFVGPWLLLRLQRRRTSRAGSFDPPT